MKNFNAINDVAKARLCTGCGNCAFAVADKITMQETADENRRPVQSAPFTKGEKDKIRQFCPALGGVAAQENLSAGDHLTTVWGPVLEVWEGYAADDEIRYRGSSGGAVTALALFAIEQQGFSGCLHIKAKKDQPLLNEAAYSTDRAALLEGSGSRYAPASVCDGLHYAQQAPGPSVVVGKPCEIKAVEQARQADPVMAEKVGLTLSIFCAGTPSHQGTKALLKQLKPRVNSLSVAHLKYRGEGWPGTMQATWHSRTNPKGHARAISYDEGWGKILQKHRQWRCHTCEDHTGEYADIAVGDPWQTPQTENAKGRSLIVVRTERGRTMVRQAVAQGAIKVAPRDPHILFAAQPNLYTTKGAVWGRSLAMKLFGQPAPALSRAGFYCFLRLSFMDQVKSLAGTVKRMLQRRLYLPKKLHLAPWMHPFGGQSSDTK